MRNQKNHTPPHIKINCWMYHLFLTPPIGVLCCRISLAAHNPQQAVPQNSRPEWNAASACASAGKLHPTLLTNSGSHFPPRPSTGNRIPFIGRILGCSFHRAPQRETASHSKGKFRDKVSESPLIRKAHPTLNTSGYVFQLPATPRLCNVAPDRRRLAA